MRIVLDTNVLVSACLKPEGIEARVVLAGLSGEFEICVTGEVAAEYREVLGREKFSKFRPAAEMLLATVGAKATWVLPGERVEAARDEADNRFLECASAAKAKYLVSGNLRDFPPFHEETEVVNARRFIDYSLLL